MKGGLNQLTTADPIATPPAVAAICPSNPGPCLWATPPGAIAVGCCWTGTGALWTGAGAGARATVLGGADLQMI